MRMSDWSSYVCSSDLHLHRVGEDVDAAHDALTGVTRKAYVFRCHVVRSFCSCESRKTKPFGLSLSKPLPSFLQKKENPSTRSGRTEWRIVSRRSPRSEESHEGKECVHT